MFLMALLTHKTLPRPPGTSAAGMGTIYAGEKGRTRPEPGRWGAVFIGTVLGKKLAAASLLLQHQAKVERRCKSKPEVSCRQMVQLDVCVSKHKLLEGTGVGGWGG